MTAGLIEASVAVVGSGACTPVGLTPAGTIAAVRAGVANKAAHPFMRDRTGAPMIVARVPGLDASMAGAARFLAMARRAADQALAPLRDRELPSGCVQVFVGLPEARPGLPEALTLTFERQFLELLPRPELLRTPRLIVGGHAAGLMAIEAALGVIRRGEGHLCLVGGVDSWLEPDTLEWLEAKELLHSENESWGFCPGEAAGFLLLASHAATEWLGLQASLGVLAAATAEEPKGLKTRTVCIGEGLSAAMKQALAPLSALGRKAEHIICDMNGEPYRGDEFGFAVSRAVRYFEDDADFDAPATCWGDVGAASGPLFALLAGAPVNRGKRPRAATLVYASSEAGRRSAAVVTAAAR